MDFSALGLLPELARAVADKGYSVPTPIQAQAIPAVLAGRDVLGGAQTGTGKTAAFVLPLLQRLGTHAPRGPRALVLAPTRELAAQVAASAADYGKYRDLKVEAIFGGVSINPQIDKLRRGCDLLVATPGRLLDLTTQRAVSLAGVQTFVLDEADRMLDMGFIRDIKRVMQQLPPVRQNLLFSATYSDDIRSLAGQLLRDPAMIEVTPRNATADKVDQRAYRVPKDHKRHLLAHLIKTGNWHQVLIFTRTKHGANRLAQQLDRAGITTAAIHGNKSQNARVRALEDFKSNRVVALVATEVAARGLDIKELPYVVNYELPNVPEDYVHRIGRTARAGSTGQAVSLVSPDEAPLLRDIERLLKRSVEFAAAPAFDIREPTPAPAVAAEAPRAPSDVPARDAAARASSGRTQQRRDGRSPYGGERGGRRDARRHRHGGQQQPQRDARGGRDHSQSASRPASSPGAPIRDHRGAASGRDSRSGQRGEPRRSGGNRGDPRRGGERSRGGPSSANGQPRFSRLT
jgi:ATP-dependent RNA helicase RhlE